MTSRNPFPSVIEQQEAEIRQLRAELMRAKGELEAAEKHVEILGDHCCDLHKEAKALRSHRNRLAFTLAAIVTLVLFFTVPR